MSDHPTVVVKSFWYKVLLLVYPFLLAYYPVFALRNHNIVYVDLATILRTLILVTIGTALIAIIAYLLLRNLEKSSIIAALIAILFLSYGHLYILLSDALGSPVHHSYLAGAEGLLFLGITILVLKKDQVARVLSQFLAAVGIVLLAMALFESLRYDIGVYRAISAAAQIEAATTRTQSNADLPDFYLIVLDAHTRSDVLASRFGYDNSSFIQQLNEMGFYVSTCSQSNYASTKLSLVSALYGDYIQNIVKAGEVLPPLKTSAVNETLKSLGYTSIAFENRASGHFDLKEDILLSRNQMALGRFDLRGGFGEFERMMIDTSFMRFLVDTELIPGFDSDTLWDWELREHYAQTQYILTELEKLPEMPGPKFIYAHIMVPHSPFVFAPDGSYQRNDSPIDGYRSNTEFIDNRLPSVLHAIIEKSKPNPIIVVMGDHGPSTRKTITKQMRMANLSAYLVNEAAKAQMYPTMTPVNGFRIILNAHYGGAYPPLEDLSYYAYKPDQLPDAEVIANDCQPSHK
jgi:hypothetical protein